ncbi:Hypothetical protein (Fragment) [Durusdinium trenchii]|uniref:Uncharacterized protein n=2 Tax=Durusdinium trenchii TaxID=1381693 RepID=A0ABP0P518_9DINO
MATGVYNLKVLNDNWFEDRCQPAGSLSATTGIDRKYARPHESDLAYIGERFDVLARISRLPNRPSYALPLDGFDEKVTTNLADFKDPRSRNDWGKGKAVAPTMITTANAPVCPPETRELPGPRSGFGAHLNRHPDNHDQRFFHTTHGHFYGEGTRKKEKPDAASIPHSAGISTEMAEGQAHGMKVGILCGEAYNDSKNPGCNTKTQRSWLYEPDAALQNIHYGGKKPPVPTKDSELSIPIGEGAMSKVRADMKARQGRLYRVATHITKGNHHRPGISIFQDDVIEAA